MSAPRTRLFEHDKRIETGVRRSAALTKPSQDSRNQMPQTNISRKRKIAMISDRSRVDEVSNEGPLEMSIVPPFTSSIDVSDMIIPVSAEVPSQRPNTDVSSLTEDDFRGGIVSDDDSWLGGEEDDQSDEEPITDGPKSDATAQSSGESSMEIDEEVVPLEPLDFRVAPRYESVIQNERDWELIRPTLLRMLYER